MHAHGTFEVKIKPLALDGPAADERLGRMSIEKQFHGDLVATGLGQMLTAMTSTEGSAAYTAVERVSGTLAGRQGSFALVHRGVMSRAGMELSVTIVPDSGEGELEGIAGQLAIVVAGGVHSYDLEYTLPDKP